MNIEEHTASVLLLLAFTGSISAIYLAFRGRNSSAGIVAAFSVTLIVLTALPSIELIKAWGMEARLRGQVIEAKSVLNELRSANAVLIAQGYNTLTTESLLGTTRLADLLDTASDLDNAVKRIGFGADKTSKARDRFYDQLAYRAGMRFLGERNSKVQLSEDAKREIAKDSFGFEKEAREFKKYNFVEQVRGDRIIKFIPPPEREKFVRVWEQIGRDLVASSEGRPVSPLLEASIGMDMDALGHASEEWLKTHP